MKLSEKLARYGAEADALRAAEPRRRAAAPSSDRRRRLREQVLREVGPALSAGDSQIRAGVATAIRQAASSEGDALAEQVRSDVLGYGPLDPFLRDPAVNEIMCNGFDEIWVERDGHMERSDAAFTDDAHYRTVIGKIVAGAGRRLDEASAMVDARLPDGSRVNAVLPPLSVHGPVLTVRRFRAEGFGVKDLVNNGTMSLECALLLEACVRGRQNMLISGGTGSGKTTTLNVLSSFIPAGERIITIEDAAELRLGQPHVVSLEYRPANVEGRGEVTIRDLVRNALRMRPDRIVVGEVRGGEALDMLQAMNTGHEGSLTTIHANGPRDALMRVETMVLMAGFDLPIRAIREQIAGALDLIVHQERGRDGRRRIVEVAEVHGMEGDTIVMQTLFTGDRTSGKLQPTGLRPRLLERLAERGVDAPPPWERAAAASTATRRAGAKRGRR